MNGACSWYMIPESVRPDSVIRPVTPHLWTRINAPEAEAPIEKCSVCGALSAIFHGVREQWELAAMEQPLLEDCAEEMIRRVHVE